jgi:hypothetical protein
MLVGYSYLLEIVNHFKQANDVIQNIKLIFIILLLDSSSPKLAIIAIIIDDIHMVAKIQNKTLFIISPLSIFLFEKYGWKEFLLFF